MTSGSNTILTVSQSFGPDSIIKDLKSSASSTSSNTDNSRDIVWKELGEYLEKLTEVPSQESNFKNDLNLTKPLSTAIQYRICNICNRPILTHYLPKHIKLCLEMKQQKEKATTENNVTVTNKPATANQKKRARDQTPTTTDDAPTPKLPKHKKNKKEANPSVTPIAATRTKKRSTAKNKGPVDVEKQCGVALPDGGFCARSLTCKTHSMGAKRAVPGRSAPYDTLLAAYQHKNQVKIAGQAAKAQADKDELIHGGSKTLDSDEETQLVLSGVSKSFPLPLERRSLVPTRIRSNFLRMREMFAGAILPRISSVGGMTGRTAVIDVDNSNDRILQVKASPRNVGVKVNPQMKSTNPNAISQPNGNTAHTNTPANQQAALLAQQRNVFMRQRAAQVAQAQAQAQVQAQVQAQSQAKSQAQATGAQS